MRLLTKLLGISFGGTALTYGYYRTTNNGTVREQRMEQIKETIKPHLGKSISGDIRYKSAMYHTPYSQQNVIIKLKLLPDTITNEVDMMYKEIFPYSDDRTNTFLNWLATLPVIRNITVPIYLATSSENEVKFRCNKAQVVDFLNPRTGQSVSKDVKEAISKFWFPEMTYRVGQIVEVLDYDMNLEEQCSRGIHYFQS